MNLLLIIPCYNESRRVEIPQFEKALKAFPGLSFRFVDDGSSDATFRILEVAGERFGERWSVVRLERNAGKAEAVRHGILSAPAGYENFGYWDADLATPLGEILEMISLANFEKQIVIASRWKRLGAEVKRNELRHYFGRVFATMASIILKLPVYDTQCGAKIFSAAMRELFEEPFTSRWLFDVEILARFRNKFGRDAALRDIVEYPVGSWIEKGDSRVKASYIFKMPFEMWRIAQRYNRLRQDDRQA